MTIKKILESLTSEQKRRLFHAFDHNFSQHVEYTPGRFVGVNVRGSLNLQIDTLVGVWSTGEIK